MRSQKKSPLLVAENKFVMHNNVNNIVASKDLEAAGTRTDAVLSAWIAMWGIQGFGCQSP